MRKGFVEKSCYSICLVNLAARSYNLPHIVFAWSRCAIMLLFFYRHVAVSLPNARLIKLTFRMLSVQKMVRECAYTRIGG